MLVSVYCAIGLLSAFLVYIWINTVWMVEERKARKISELEEEEKGEEEVGLGDTDSAIRKKND